MDRNSKIVRVSGVSIAANTVLVVFKLAVGFATNSIAIVLDGINNLTDAASSLITIIGTKLAGRAADKAHPYGYGRIEYLTGVVIASLVLITGVTSAKESITQIIWPQTSTYSTVSLVIIAVAIVVKILIGRYVKSRGEQLQSTALTASGADALFDAVLSAGTLLAAFATLLWGVQLDGWLGTIIAIVIIKAGVEMLIEALNTIIGERSNPELVNEIKAVAGRHEGVLGVYDVYLHAYGAEKILGSLHIEVPDDMRATRIDELTRKIMDDVYKETGVVVTVGIYASNNSTPALEALHDRIESVACARDGVLSMHGFYVDGDDVKFDLVFDYTVDPVKLREVILSDLRVMFPDKRFAIQIDANVSDQ